MSYSQVRVRPLLAALAALSCVEWNRSSPGIDASISPGDAPVAPDRRSNGVGGGSCGTIVNPQNRSCFGEASDAATCPSVRRMTSAMTPLWRITSLVITQPFPLANRVIEILFDGALRDGRFLWGLGVDLGANTFRTGSMQWQDRGRIGLGLIDGTFRFRMGTAPGVDPNRWNPLTGGMSLQGEELATNRESGPLWLPVFNPDDSLGFELPLSDLRFLRVPLRSDRGCVGLAEPFAGRFDECCSRWRTNSGGIVEAVVTVAHARQARLSIPGLPVSNLCDLLAGASCASPMSAWPSPPDSTTPTGEPAYTFRGGFTALSSDIQ